MPFLPFLLLAVRPWENAYNSLSLKVVTPRVKFARPLHAGRLKALAIVPRWVAREVIELEQRFDCEATPVLTYTATALGAKDPYTSRCPGTLEPDKVAELREKLKGRYDLYIVGNFDWSRLPPEARYRILRAVKGGAGLVFVRRPPVRGELRKLFDPKREVDAKPILVGTPFGALSAFEGRKPSEVVKAYALGKGRAVVLDYGPVGGCYYYQDSCLTPKVEFDDETWVEYEVYHSLLAKACLFAARRLPEVRIASISGPEGAIDIRRLPAPLLTMRVANGSGGEFKGRARVDALDTFGRWEGGWGSDLVVPKGGGTFNLSAPELPAGSHFLLVRLYAEGKVVDWAWWALDVSAPVEIAALSPDRPSVEPGERLTLSARLSASPPEGAEIALHVYDNFGRLLWADSKPVEGRKLDLSLDVPPRSGILLRVWADLRVAKKVWDRALLRLPVPDRMEDDFLFLIWGHGQDFWLTRRFREQAAKYGFDAVDLYYIAGYEPAEVERFCRNLFEANLRVVPYMWRFYYGGRRLVREPCLTDPEYRRKVTEKMTELARALAPYGPPGYTLGDENFLAPHGVDVCRSKTCLARFREHLRRKYGSLERLNEAWGTNFPSFDLLVPPTFSEAKERGLEAAWAEHREFMETVFDEIHDLALDAIRKVDPKARVGFDGNGPTDSWHGYDWAKLLDKFRLMGTYHNLPEVEIVRSLARKGTLLGSWYGGYVAQRRPELLRWLPWSMLATGYNSCWYFSTTHAEGAFAPDLSPHEHFLWQLPEMWAIRSGMGKLFVNCEKLHDGVAVLYSQPSVHAATLDGELEGWREAHRGAILALKDLGVGFEYVSYLDLRKRGAKALDGFKLLLLPLTQALSAEEARAVREFVEGGGWVAADLRPGIADEICRPVEGGALSDLFGARLGPRPKPIRSEGSVRWGGLALTLGSVRADASVRPDGAEVLGQAGRAPIVLVNRKGKGGAVLLNFALAAYEGLRGTEGAEPLLALLGRILRKAGVEPFISLTDEKGRPARRIEVALFRGGEGLYLVLLRDPNVKGRWRGRVRLREPKFVHDMRKGLALGRRRTFEVELRPGEAKAFSLLPYEVRRLDISAPKEAERGGDLTVRVSLDASGEVTGLHVVRVEFEDGSGKYLRPLTRKLLYPGDGEAKVRIALNDAPGVWTVKALDVATGARAMARIRVR